MTTFVHILFFFSGAAALGYQLVWAKMFSTGMGHEFPAVLGVICAFMGGMGVGSWVLARPISAASNTARWFAFLQTAIGIWGGASVFLIPAVNGFAPALAGIESSAWRQWGMAFAIPFIILLPSTIAMGATFAAMERWLGGLLARGVTSSVALVYASNTAGAVAGTLVTTFVLMPALGFRKSALALAAISIACGVAALALPMHAPAASLKKERISKRLGLTLFFTGLLGIGYEAAAVRVLSIVLENTIYTFAVTLATFLMGTALGGAIYHHYARKKIRGDVTSRLVIWVGSACVAGIWPMAWSQKLYDGLRNMAGANVIAEWMVAVLVLLPATMLMGMLFSHLVQSGAQSLAGVGRLFALNALGGAAAPVLVGVAVFPSLGAKGTLVAIALGYVALAAKWSGLKWSPIVFIAVTLSIIPANLKLLNIPPGGKLIAFSQGVMASVAVIEDSQGERTLRINNRFQQGGTAAANAEYRQAHIPLLLHRQPRSALFLGVGTGITLGAATLYADLRVDGVELVPEVAQMIPKFESANFGVPKPPAINVIVADARRYVQSATSHYDVVIADLFHPAMDGAGLLYTTEHFRAIRQRLSADGIFCQWLPLYQMDESLLRTVVRTFMGVFPEAQAWLLRFNVDAPVLGLIGWASRPQYGAQWVETRLTDPNLERYVRQLTLSESVRFFTHALLDAPALRDFCGVAPLNTDDMPRVVFAAPRASPEGTEPARTLLALLELPMPNPSSVLTDPGSADGRARLAAAWKGRYRYLHGLIAEGQGREGEAIDAYVDSARLSPDFTLGYARCATLASIRAETNPKFARELLQRLLEAQPGQPLARDMLQRLFP